MNDLANELLKKSGCRIVIVDDPETAIALENAISATAPDYRNRINEVFYSQKKIGPFHRKNKTPLWNILKKTEDAKRHDNAFLLEHIRHSGLHGYDMRVPIALGILQKKLASMVYDTMNGVCSFLINDLSIITENGNRIQLTDKNPLCDVISWLYAYRNRHGKRLDLIWISDLPPRKIIETFGPNEFESGCFSIYKVIDRKITPVDKEAYGKEFLKWHHTKTAFEEGQSYDWFSEINLVYKRCMPKSDDPAKALSFYKIAAEAGHPGAQYALGRWFSRSAASPSEKEQALCWFIKAAFIEEFEDPDDAVLLTQLRTSSRQGVNRLLIDLPNGKTILRNQLGDRAEEIIKKAELLAQEYAHKKKIDDVVNQLMASMSQEEKDALKKEMDDFLGKI